MTWLRRRLNGSSGEAGLTLIELLVAAAMSVVLVGAAASMMISAVQTQPELSKRSQDISSARWILERMTREIRNGIAVEPGANGAVVSFTAYVRQSSCGSSTPLPPESSAIECEITYDCSGGTSCTRKEVDPELPIAATPKTIFTGIASEKVFNFSPSPSEATFIGVTLRFPNPDGDGFLTVSDGASLRTADVLN
jgi:type II secretory pathway pseudopilin PulG